MKNVKRFRTAWLCFLAAAAMLASGCNSGRPPASSTDASTAGTTTSTSPTPGSTTGEGTTSSASVDADAPTTTVQAQTNARTTASSSTASRSTAETARKTTVPSGLASYDYGRTPVSSDWNQRFNISTGFAFGGGGNKEMYEKVIGQTKAANFTTIEINGINITDPDPDGPGKAEVRRVIRVALEACRKYHIGAYVQDPYLGGFGNESRAIEERHVKEALDAYRDYTDVIQAYFLWDEPFKEQFPLIKQRYDWVRKYDKNIRLFVNLFPSYGQYGWTNTEWEEDSYTSYVDEFIETAKPDMLSVDYYAFGTSGSNQPDLLAGTEMLWRDMGYFRKKAMENQVPFEFYIQCAGKMFDDFDRIGNMDIHKISVQMWAALAYGVKRVSYWTSYGVLLDGNGNKTSLYEPIKSLNREALTVGQFLFDKTTVSLYHSGVGNLAAVRDRYYIDDLANSRLLSEIPSETIVSVFKDASGGEYIMIANKDYTFSAEGRLVFKSPKKLARFNAAANRLEEPTKAVHSIEIAIPAGGYALYKIS